MQPQSHQQITGSLLGQPEVVGAAAEALHPALNAVGSHIQQQRNAGVTLPELSDSTLGTGREQYRLGGWQGLHLRLRLRLCLRIYLLGGASFQQRPVAGSLQASGQGQRFFTQ